MRIRFGTLLLCICMSACNNSSTNGSGDGSSASSINKEKIQGIWTDTSGNRLEIARDSLMFGEGENYPYVVFRDTLKVNYGDHILTGLLRFQQDTLYITTGGETSRYWKAK